jgi:hypothetical protein
MNLQTTLFRGVSFKFHQGAGHAEVPGEVHVQDVEEEAFTYQTLESIGFSSVANASTLANCKSVSTFFGLSPKLTFHAATAAIAATAMP